jgi:hypothetical protein
VIAITSGVRDMQAVLNLVWDKLLPAMSPKPLPDDVWAQQSLSALSKVLSLKRQDGLATPPKLTGERFKFPANPQKLESIAIKSDAADQVTLTARFDGTERTIVCTRNSWTDGKTAWGRFPEQPAAATGAWASTDTFVAKVCFYETPFVVMIRLTREADTLRVQTETNVGFGATKDAPLVGTLEK